MAFGLSNSLNSSRATFVSASVMDIGQGLFLACLWIETESRSILSVQKKSEANIQPSLPNKLVQ